jgi:glycosyltransferase involved in cell wall biosynthesis
MYKNIKIAVVIPAYNEEKLVKRTIDELPEFLDYIIVINDGSKDSTLEVLKGLEKHHPKLTVLDNDTNHGIGYSIIRGFKYALEKTDAAYIGITAADSQCDPNYMKPMLEEAMEFSYDYVKANRFFHRDALKAMPKYRKIGNVFISLLTKFSTGYYSISDTQNGFGFLSRRILEKVNFSFVADRYDYENTMLVAMAIAGARIKDYPVPAIYGDEKSSIKFWPTAMRALRAVWVGFWRRIYYKYVLYSFHPIALFLFAGLLLSIIGFLYGVYIVYEKLINHLSPSTATVMLVALPLIVGFQMILTSLVMDVSNEGK